ncbi:hypothetical protein D3C71_1786880 [compost metagenome]
MDTKFLQNRQVWMLLHTLHLANSRGEDVLFHQDYETYCMDEQQWNSHQGQLQYHGKL